MSELQAHVKNQGEILVVRFSGRVDVESAPPFRRACQTHLQKKKVVFDFGGMNFVGSAGILPFLEAIEEFAKLNPDGIKFCGVGLEFQRVLAATTLGSIEIWDNDSQAVHAYHHPRPRQQVTTASGLMRLNQVNPVAAEAAPTLALRYETSDDC